VPPCPGEERTGVRVQNEGRKGLLCEIEAKMQIKRHPIFHISLILTGPHRTVEQFLLTPVFHSLHRPRSSPPVFGGLEV
jgi:hypothetical protein